jgi:hypothetical protein
VEHVIGNSPDTCRSGPEVSGSNLFYRPNEREIFLLMIALDNDVERGPITSRRSASIVVISLTSCDNQHAFGGHLTLLGSLSTTSIRWVHVCCGLRPRSKLERSVSGLTQNFVMRRFRVLQDCYLGLMKRA